ncbi:MAG: polymer-forming cytoskeletal protein [Bacteroidia bacterium]|nr:polymer-forming cytoskeletal protein [Bacteroidia bacterium]MDW8157433.1 polymer-forming cytoskeletal protein [Bacteroidia bacterium]
MFSKGNKKQAEDKKSAEPALSIIAVGTTIVGDIVSEGDIRVEGQILGRLVCKSKLVVGNGGRIKGTVDTENAVIAGEISGNILVRNTLQIQESGKVVGEIITQKLVVQEGAILSGNCKMGSDAQELLKRTPIPDLLSSAKAKFEEQLLIENNSSQLGGLMIAGLETENLAPSKIDYKKK